jgi:hypothetical protein
MDLTVSFLVGARFVCLPCRRRSVDAVCACGEPTLDLARDDDGAELAARWPAAAAHARGRSILDPRVALASPAIRAVTLVAVAGTAVAATFGPILDHRATTPAEVLAAVVIGAIVAAVMSPITAALIGLTLFYAAHAMRLLSVLVGALAGVSPFERRKLRDVAWIYDLLQRPFLPLIEVALPPEPGVRVVEGALVEPLRIEVRRDALSLLQRHDALVPAFDLARADGSLERVTLEAGAVRWPAGAGARLDARRDDDPAWLRTGRPGVAFARELPAGAGVRVTRVPASELLVVELLPATAPRAIAVALS